MIGSDQPVRVCHLITQFEVSPVVLSMTELCIRGGSAYFLIEIVVVAGGDM